MMFARPEAFPPVFRRGLKIASPIAGLVWSVSALADAADSVPPATTGGGQVSSLRADAGDDQIGLVGRQITLNASRSEPRGEVGFRWVQVGGPTVPTPTEDGYILAFTPRVAGVYRFAV